MFRRQQENAATLEEKFSTRSMLKYYEQEQLAVAVRGLLEFNCCELLLLEAGS
jgi:hypothetical protein